MDQTALLHSLRFGGILAAALFVFIIGGMLFNRELWLNNYPGDIRQKYGPPAPRTVRQRRGFGIAMLAIQVIVILWDALTLPAGSGAAHASFLSTLRSTLIVFLCGSLMDFLVIDTLLGMVLRVKFMVLPGTEGLAGYRNLRFHFDAFLRGVFAGAVLCAVLSGIAQLVFIAPF
jgi:hypothetical protein